MQRVMQLVVFTLGGEPFALPIERVQEIIRHQPPRPVASPVPCVAGVIGLRGRVLPVCDIAARVGARPVAAEQPKIVIVDLPGGPAGVVVDGVDAVLTVEGDGLQPVPAEVATDLVSGIARLGERLVMVLDPDRVLAGVAEAPPAPAPKPKRKPAAPKPPPAPRKRAAQPSR